MDWGDRIGRRLKLRDLHILLAVVQSGSMSKAAQQLSVSNPVVTRGIADLEHTLGVRLLDRTPRGVELTSYGRALLKRSTAAFDELRQGVQDINFLSNPEAGELHVGAAPAASEGIVLAVIDRLSRHHPRAEFHVVAGDTMTVCKELRERRVEIGLVRMSGTSPDDDLDQEVLFEEPIVVVAGVDSPWTRRRKIRLAELVNEPWTWPTPGTIIDLLVVEAFRASGLKAPRATVYADSFNMRTRLAATGRFLAVVPAGILRFAASHTAMARLPVEFPTTHLQIGVVTLKNRTLSPLAQRFIECAREVAGPLTERR
jgi:DNA-binding transcriptional LysR family regulator